jgi:hypothetical protein
MATNSSQETLSGAGFSPLRGEPSMGSIPLPLLGGTFTNTFTPTTLSTAGAVTYTAAQLIGGLILRDPNGSGRSDVTPTAAQIVASLPGAAIGQSFQFDLVNTADGNETITLTAGTGVTVSGTATVAQNNGKRWIVYVTAATAGSEAVVVRSLGTYTA